MPTVSVIIPTYNRAQYVCEAVESVLAQTYQDFEIIVVDDGSTDDTEERLRPYMDRIRYARQANAGPSVARNRGILASSGEYTAFLDSDDLWNVESKLEHQVSFFERLPDVGAIYSNYVYGEIPTDSCLPLRYPKQPPPSGNIFVALAEGKIGCCPSSIVVRKSLFAEAGLFDPTLRGLEDYDLWLRFSAVTQFQFVNKAYAFVRKGRHEHLAKSTASLEDTVRAVELQRVRWAKRSDVADQFRLNYLCHQTNLAWHYRNTGRLIDAGRSFLKASKFCNNRRARWRYWIRGLVYMHFPWILALKRRFNCKS
jgi:glycosyltransferase involved in cell wall biosynthesis